MPKLDHIHIACVITTHNRIAEAKGLMDIIKELWQPFFGKIDIYHEFNGQPDWYPRKYREDFLFRHHKMPHFDGAVYLIEQGVNHVLESGREYDFIVVATGDAWIYDPEKLYGIFRKMIDEQCDMANSIWFMVGLATEFFVIRPSLARKIFPLHYDQFVKGNKVSSFMNIYLQGEVASRLTWTKVPLVEAYFAWQTHKQIGSIKKLLLIPGRRFVFAHNKSHSGDFYSSDHNPLIRKKIVAPKLKRFISDNKPHSPLVQEILN